MYPNPAYFYSPSPGPAPYPGPTPYPGPASYPSPYPPYSPYGSFGSFGNINSYPPGPSAPGLPGMPGGIPIGSAPPMPASIAAQLQGHAPSPGKPNAGKGKDTGEHTVNIGGGGVGQRDMPHLSEAELIANYASLELNEVRSVAEWATNGDPYSQVDYTTYMQLWDWCKSDEKRKIILGILKSRLKLPPPYSHKALVLTQLLPASDLPQLASELRPLSKPPPDPKPGDLPAPNNPFITSLGASLLAQAEKEQAAVTAAKKAADEKKKYEWWTNLYGKPEGGASMPPLPPPIEWGLWAFGRPPVGAEEWWKK
ncbi:hypothetical protein M231_03119 [Tremella mesenterica]|uniref:Uncharacterized protein n=1 Tax=Tremella mesenterica TaxID=5217 RepID=A0A4V1M498_TREME|nr:hypothetical protein M231_03119 [Tremella mesenterica]